ncbi:hypothetical protein JNUCC0626_43180 [Lentzea sp. JNUCC 0626]|uniref:hypothetical protein n=1 Tax=Lentzea sp. JNUCC 0626 TaxID=3367513 RepID=UPI003747D695
MVVSGGWRVFAGALVLAAGLVAPATGVAAADPVACTTWTESTLPVPDGVGSSGVVAAAGSYVVGTGSYRWVAGSAVLIWKDRQLVDHLSFFRHTAYATDVNSSGVVALSGSTTFPAASRWQAGVYTTLNGWQGEYDVRTIDVNERGDVLGVSNGKPVVWPAGSGQARLVPGTDASWSATALADDGAVLAGSASGVYWLSESGAVQLEGGTDVSVTAARGQYAVGRLGQEVVRWDRQGQVVRGFEQAVEVLGVNAHGQLLGEVDNGTTEGSPAFWAGVGYPERVNTDARVAVIADDGALYGAKLLDPWNAYPVALDCANGAR